MGLVRAQSANGSTITVSNLNELLGTPTFFNEAAPAAGVNTVTWTVPAGTVRFRPQTILTSMLSNGNAGGRSLNLFLFSAGVLQVGTVSTPFIQAPNEAITYTYSVGNISQVGLGGIIVNNPLPEIDLVAGDTIVIQVADFDGGDQLGDILIRGNVFTI